MADNPGECFKRGLIPSNLLRPGDLQLEIDSWINKSLFDEMPDKSSICYPDEIENFLKKKEFTKER